MAFSLILNLALAVQLSLTLEFLLYLAYLKSWWVDFDSSIPGSRLQHQSHSVWDRLKLQFYFFNARRILSIPVDATALQGSLEIKLRLHYPLFPLNFKFWRAFLIKFCPLQLIPALLLLCCIMYMIVGYHTQREKNSWSAYSFMLPSFSLARAGLPDRPLSLTIKN